MDKETVCGDNSGIIISGGKDEQLTGRILFTRDLAS